MGQQQLEKCNYCQLRIVMSHTASLTDASTLLRFHSKIAFLLVAYGICEDGEAEPVVLKKMSCVNWDSLL